MPRLLSIVIPCYNEEKAISPVLAQVQAALPGLHQVGVEEVEILVVDDASTDRSGEILQQWPQVTVVRNSTSLKYGGSLQRGFGLARGELIGFCDMDATYDPAEFAKLIGALDEHDAGMVCGNRLQPASRMPWIRWLGNTAFVWLINLLFHQKIQDSCTGQRIFRTCHKDDFCNLRSNGLNYSLMMTLHCLTHQIRLIEIPVSYSERLGTSKLNVVSDGWRFLTVILRSWVSFMILTLKHKLSDLR